MKSAIRVVAFELESGTLSHIADAAARDGQFIKGGGDMRSERRLLVAPRRSFRRRAAGLLMELLCCRRRRYTWRRCARLLFHVI